MSDRERTLLRSRHIGFVFQAFHLLPYRTATENVALPLMYHGVPRDTRLKAADEALADVGLFHRRQMLSTKLSGGERQRVAIARALVTKPSLVLCDEPTGNLDSASAERVLDILDRLNHAGMTLMVVTHDSSVAGRAQRCWKIADGQMKEAVR
jgi:putative ABC transport system ATP-binding protein